MSSAKEQTVEKVNDKVSEKVQEKSKAVQAQRVYEYSPDVDIYSDKTAIYIEANLPGVDDKHIDVTVEKSILTIRGEVDTAVPENFRLEYAEYFPGNFRRSFQLGEDVNHEAIEAVIKNGVLRLRLPLKEATTRKITVRAE